MMRKNVTAACMCWLLALVAVGALLAGCVGPLPDFSGGTLNGVRIGGYVDYSFDSDSSEQPIRFVDPLKMEPRQSRGHMSFVSSTGGRADVVMLFPPIRADAAALCGNPQPHALVPLPQLVKALEVAKQISMVLAAHACTDWLEGREAPEGYSFCPDVYAKGGREWMPDGGMVRYATNSLNIFDENGETVIRLTDREPGQMVEVTPESWDEYIRLLRNDEELRPLVGIVSGSERNDAAQRLE